MGPLIMDLPSKTESIARARRTILEIENREDQVRGGQRGENETLTSGSGYKVATCNSYIEEVEPNVTLKPWTRSSKSLFERKKLSWNSFNNCLFASQL